MSIKKSNLYILVGVALFLGYFWTFFNLIESQKKHSIKIEFCLIKSVTGLPCPSCGSTRSVLSIAHGDIITAMLWNPIGIFLVLLMLILPVWIVYDLILRKDSFYKFYFKVETFLKIPIVAITAILLVIINWIWNICKGV